MDKSDDAEEVELFRQFDQITGALQSFQSSKPSNIEKQISQSVRGNLSKASENQDQKVNQEAPVFAPPAWIKGLSNPKSSTGRKALPKNTQASITKPSGTRERCKSPEQTSKHTTDNPARTSRPQPVTTATSSIAPGATVDGLIQPQLQPKERSTLLSHSTLTPEQTQKLLCSFGLKNSGKSVAHLKQVFDYVFLERVEEQALRGYRRDTILQELQKKRPEASGQTTSSNDRDLDVMLGILDREVEKRREKSVREDEQSTANPPVGGGPEAP